MSSCPLQTPAIQSTPINPNSPSLPLISRCNNCPHSCLSIARSSHNPMAAILDRISSCISSSSYSPPPLINCGSAVSVTSSSLSMRLLSGVSDSWRARLLRGIAFSTAHETNRTGRRVISHALAEVQDQSAPSQTDNATVWWERDFGATVKDVHSIQELEELVASSQDRLVVVEFFATWCGSCRALYPKLCKLAAEHKDVIFVKVNCDENRQFCKSLHINVLPYFHFYRGVLEQVDSFSCSISKLQKLKDTITKYNGVSCHDGNTDICVED